MGRSVSVLLTMSPRKALLLATRGGWKVVWAEGKCDMERGDIFLC